MVINPVPEAAQAVGARLPSGRHHLTRTEVTDSQRGRLGLALITAVAEKGFPAITIADVVIRAGVSRRTFYEHFASKEACFLDAIDATFDIVVGEMDRAILEVHSADWRDYVRASLGTYLESLASVPSAAWALHVETLSAGAAVAERRAQMSARFAHRMRGAFQLAQSQETDLADVPDQAFDLLVGGIDERIRHCLRTHGASSLPELAPLLVWTTCALFGARP